MVFLSPLFILLASICNALMDTVENENFYKSRFKGLNEKFWYKRESWKYAKRVFGWKLDIWHIFKSLMIIFIVLSIIFYKPFILILDFIMLGIIWNIGFNTFYNKIFRINEKL